MSSSVNVPPTLLLGWPRGGLGYVQKLLQAQQHIAGKTYNQTLTANNLKLKQQKAETYELSSVAWFFLAAPELYTTRIIFIARHPLHVLNSISFYGLFDLDRNSVVRQLALQHIPDFARHTNPLDAAAYFLKTCYSFLQEARPNYELVRVEAGPVGLLHKITGKAPAVNFYCCPDPPSVSYCRQQHTLSTLPPTAKSCMQELLYELDYARPVWNPRDGHAHYNVPLW